MVSGKQFEKINIFVQQPNNMSEGRGWLGYLVWGIVVVIVGWRLIDSVSADINQCQLTWDGFGFMGSECNQVRTIAAFGAILYGAGGIMLIIAGLKLGILQFWQVVDDRSSVVSTQSETAFCNKCGNPYSLRTSESNFCPKCGNPLTH